MKDLARIKLRFMEKYNFTASKELTPKLHAVHCGSLPDKLWNQLPAEGSERAWLYETISSISSIKFNLHPCQQLLPSKQKLLSTSSSAVTTWLSQSKLTTTTIQR